MRIPSDILRKCWVLAGPTACGKTAVSLQLAGRIHAEIVALDSMSLYRGMDIGTAKATPQQQQRVPHHLIDIIEPHEEYSVAQYLESALRVCQDIVSRGRVPLFVGGTGLYLRAIVRGVFEGPPADWDLRRRLEAAAGDPEALHRRLAEVDPATALRLHPNDQRRIIRALEIYELSGQPVSQLQQQRPLPPEQRPATIFWLSPPRDWLYGRINLRVEQMIESGLVDEVRRLLRLPQPMSRTARQALGYREIIDHLQGNRTREDAIERIQTSTRQFAKRQHTWFRNLEECRTIAIDGRESVAELVDRLVTAAGDPLPQLHS